MKRFMLFIAMVGFVATSCSKTIVKDEVETAISFSTESAKLTRAIVQNNPDPNIVNGGVYFTNQPFGVFAYSHQKDAAGNVIPEKTTKVMDNVEVYYDDETDANNPVWRASGDVKYYWPNDPRTSMDFYAFSPACSTANVTKTLAAHQQLNGTVDHTEADGFSLTDYSHGNMYVDFMLATPVKGATYVNPDGSNDNDVDGVVPMVFNHKMTQIVFDVTTDNVYPGVKFTVEEITLKNIVSKGTYTCKADGTQAWAYANQPPKTNYTIFPANTTNGAVPPINNAVENNVEKPLVIDYITSTPTSPAKVTTTGVTMIPQNMTQTEIPYEAGSDALANESDAQVFMIKYSISGTGVAKETVTKHIPFWPSEEDIDKQGPGYVYGVVNWNINKRITYKVMIGLNEVTFEPSVADWSNEGGNEYTFKQ